jgi:hypothetical protein
MARYDINEPFEMDAGIQAFIDQYKLAGDLVKVSAAEDEFDSDIYELSESAQADVSKTKDTYYDMAIDAKLDGIGESEAAEIKAYLKKNLGDAAESLDVESSWDEQLDAIAYTCTVFTADGESFEFQPQGMYYSMEHDTSLQESGVNAFAWLGNPESPFYDSEWRNAYAQNEAATWFENTDGFAGSEDELIQGVKNILGNAEDADKSASIVAARHLA